MLDYFQKKQWTPGAIPAKIGPEYLWDGSFPKDSIRALSRPLLVHPQTVCAINDACGVSRGNTQPQLGPRVTALLPSPGGGQQPPRSPRSPAKETSASSPGAVSRGVAALPPASPARDLGGRIVGGMSIRLQSRTPPAPAKLAGMASSPHRGESLLTCVAAEAMTALPVIHSKRSGTAPAFGRQGRSPPPAREACRAARGSMAGMATTSGRGIGDHPRAGGGLGHLAADSPNSKMRGTEAPERPVSQAGREPRKAPPRPPPEPEPEMQRRKHRSYTPEELAELQHLAQCRVIERKRALTAEPRPRKTPEHSTRQSLDSFQRRTELRLEQHTKATLEVLLMEQGRERQTRTAEEVAAFQRRAQVRLSDWRRVQAFEKQRAAEEEQLQRSRHREECQAAILMKGRRRVEIYALNAILREQGQKKLELFMQGRLDETPDTVEAPGDDAGSSDEEGGVGGRVRGCETRGMPPGSSGSLHHGV